jgi:hypothetical protein
MSEVTKEYEAICHKLFYNADVRQESEASFVEQMQADFLADGWVMTGEVTIRWSEHWDDNSLMCCTLSSAVVPNDLV